MRIATRVAVFMASLMTGVGCGLNTDGLWQGDGTDASEDIEPEEIEFDDSGEEFLDAEIEDVSPPDTEDRFEVDTPETDGEIDYVTDEIGPEIDAEDAEPEDVVEDESSEEDGEAEDGGTVDPCAPPTIPTDGLYLFFCFEDDIVSELIMWRWVYRDWGPAVIWETEPGCRIASSRTLFCPVEIYLDATYYFNVEMPGTGPIGWSCGPGLTAPMGMPRVWLYGIPLAVTFVDNGAGGCNHTFTVPEL